MITVGQDNDSDDDENDEENILNINIENIEWYSIDSIDDEFNGQFSIEIVQESNKLLLISNTAGIAFVDIINNNSIQLDWIYIPSDSVKSDSFYISSHIINTLILCSNARELHIFGFV